MSRVRDKSTFHSSGTATRVTNGVLVIDQSNSVAPYQVQVADNYCEDETGKGSDHPLKIEHWSNLLQPYNGRLGDGDYVREYKNWMEPNQPAKSHLTFADLPSVGSSATSLLAKTNPGRAEVSLPVFIAEMRDLPHAIKSIKDIGDQLRRRRVPRTRDVAGQLLSWEFGWRPLLSDLRKISQFSDHVTKRVGELERLYSKGGLKRRLTLYDGTKISENIVNGTSRLGTLVQFKELKVTTINRWATVRWKPNSLPPKGASGMTRQAFQAVFGLSIQAEDVWNIVPWTWLIDWSSNIGEYLAAHSNRVPCRPSVPNVMTRTHTNIKRTRHTPDNWITGGEGNASFETLARAQSGGTIEAHLPFLSSRQLSILGSLAITRFRGSWRF